MTPGELRHWLEEPDSQSSGWASDSGETIGHERRVQFTGENLDRQGRGRKIVNILERNPEGQPGRYTDAEIDHMRRVVSYCKRHLAQEESAKRNPHSRSYRSLKNWGHDALKE
ncbi:unnamed protein product [Penicillium pancosmium]